MILFVEYKCRHHVEDHPVVFTFFCITRRESLLLYIIVETARPYTIVILSYN